MEKKRVSKKVTATILSMSLLTVMAGAAIAPALGICQHARPADHRYQPVLPAAEPHSKDSGYCYHGLAALRYGWCRFILPAIFRAYLPPKNKKGT